MPPLPIGELPRWGAKNVLPLNLIALRHWDLWGDQAVRLIRKPILYYPLFLLPSSLFGKEL